MSSYQPPDEEAILEVAREIHDPRIRAKYLNQVCRDERLFGRLEGRLISGRRWRWQFSLRTLMIVAVLLGVLASAMATSTWQAIRARQAELQAARAMQVAQEARQQAEKAKAAELVAIEAAAAEPRAADSIQSEAPNRISD